MISTQGSESSGVLSVKLQETYTLTLYEQDNESVNVVENDNEGDVQKWKTYMEKKSKGVIRIREVSSQTTARFSVDKNTQKSPIPLKTSGASVTLSDMHDEFQKLQVKDPQKSFQPRSAVYGGDRGQRGQRTADEKQKYYGDIFSMDEQEEEKIGGCTKNDGTKATKNRSLKGIKAYELLSSLGWIERMLSSTKHLHLIHLFACERDLLSSGKKVSMSSKKSKIDELWKFASAKCQNYRVNCVTFFSSTPWLLVAGCGNLNFGAKGVLVGWNVKRITEPEIWIETPSPVTAVSACPESPQYCAAAMLDGSIRVYQLDLPTHPCVLDTCGIPEKHFAPVWWIEWRDSQLVNSVFRADIGGPSFKKLVSTLKAATSGPKVEIAHLLVSSSEDGTVKEWLFSKDEGLITCSTLLRVCLPSWLSFEIAAGGGNTATSEPPEETATLPVPNIAVPTHPTSPGGERDRPSRGLPAKRGSHGAIHNCSGSKEIKKENQEPSVRKEEGILSSQVVPATCISFRPGSKTDYILGTVAGDVLLCRIFERDRVRQVFRGHTGRVSHVSWRPTGEVPTAIFLSAAVDETIRVWAINKPDNPLCVLRIPKAQGGGYLDAKWCPWYVNLLGGIHTGGLHLWDLSLSTHSPILTYTIPNATCASFSPHTRNIIVGDSNGTLHVIHLEGLKESASLFFKYATGFSKLAKLSISDI